jgi:hypothetical protein
LHDDLTTSRHGVGLCARLCITLCSLEVADHSLTQADLLGSQALRVGPPARACVKRRSAFAKVFLRCQGNLTWHVSEIGGGKAGEFTFTCDRCLPRSFLPAQQNLLTDFLLDSHTAS